MTDTKKDLWYIVDRKHNIRWLVEAENSAEAITQFIAREELPCDFTFTQVDFGANGVMMLECDT